MHRGLLIVLDFILSQPKVVYFFEITIKVRFKADFFERYYSKVIRG